MLVGSVANGLNSSGGFCAGSHSCRIPAHQRHLVPFLRRCPDTLTLVTVSASEGIDILRIMPAIFSTMQENSPAIHAVLDRVEAVMTLLHASLPVVYK